MDRDLLPRARDGEWFVPIINPKGQPSSVLCGKSFGGWCFFCWLAGEEELRLLEGSRWEDDGGPVCDVVEDVVVLDSLR